MAAEILMNPSVAGIEADGVGEMVFKCIGVLFYLSRIAI